MVDKKEQKTKRIPIRFIGSETGPIEQDGEDSADLQQLSEGAPAGEVAEIPLPVDDAAFTSSDEDQTIAQTQFDFREEVDSEEEACEDVADEPSHPEGEERRWDRFTTGPLTGERPAYSPGARQQPADALAGPLVAELVATRAELKRVEAQHADLLEKLTRRQADFENYRKRIERDKGEAHNRMTGEVVSKLLPVLDNFRRALETEYSLQANESDEFRHFFDGVELIYKQLGNVLEELGLEPIPAAGQRFDPHVHEAVVTEKTDEYEPDTVLQEIVRGYRLGNKLLRPSMVKVSTK
jgi:molecular chaperone GrpE